ncbi:WRKY transcription factor 44 [Impatiens glandulifera]|uniref:WRKY transcription factor 44 n=1 Tax=Impatiens glandulifera TaxID=253017 RepID=UPI001FB07BC0|nr:WRKY transcription factor 44 [Impatiens glandulifera]
MKIKESERVVVSKPVASRPICSNFRSFTELLAGAIDSSPPSDHVIPIPAIRPKTVRLSVSSSSKIQPEFSGANVVHKPLAKVLSKTNFSFSTNMGSSFNGNNTQIPTPSPSYQNQDQSKSLESLEDGEGKTSCTLTTTTDRPSNDGYNWRKYGQKQVKGSEFPRSYYKCTHPNCPVKKKVERSLEGSVTEFVYKGEHNHSKQKLQNRNSLEHGLIDEGNKKRKEGLGNQNEQAHQTGLGTPENSFCPSGDCEETEPKENRRRKNESLECSKGYSIVQNSPDPDVAGDGFRWRKYGQKIVKGSSYPRSYYRCTNANCNMRKYVERSSDDPTAFVTTYEGKHNHDAPTTSSRASKSTAADK